MRLCFNPDLVLRPDVNRAVVFVRDEIESGLNGFVQFLHPRHAVLLAMFNGDRTVEDGLRDWAYVGGLPGPEAAREELAGVVKSWGNLPLLLPREIVAGREIPSYDPASFVVPAERVDLDTRRCKRPIDFLHVVTFGCVVDCVYCFSRPAGATRELLSLGRLAELLEEASQLGIKTVVLSGGDPLCHPRAADLIELYVAHGITPKVSTKVPLSDRGARRLRHAGLESIQVSIDAMDESFHDSLVSRPGHHRKLLASLDHIRDAGLRLRTNTVVTSRNYPDALRLIPYLAERYENLAKIELSPYGRSLYRHQEGLFLSREQQIDLREHVATYQARYPQIRIHASEGGGTNADRRPHDRKLEDYRNRAVCSGGRWGFTLLPDGQVTMCEELYYHPAFLVGDLCRQSIMEMWNSRELHSLLCPEQSHARGPCSTCPIFAECHYGKGRCYKRALQGYGIDHPDWPDPTCPYAPEPRRF
jgi:radical SAM protein with 4Fe4S-binding SPASM domain